MTLFRTIAILAGGLILLLVVVVLRVETTRLHNEIARVERATEGYRAQARAAELELARLRNPMVIRRRMQDAVEQYTEQAAPPEAPRGRGRR